MTTRAAIYARISQDDAATGLGVARQEKDCRALAAAKGWEVGGVFIDNDVSAWKKGKARPEYTKMMEALRAETFNAVVVYNIDRLYRQPRQLEDLIDLCEHGRVGFATCAGEFDLATSPGRTMARVQVIFAIQASDDASRRQRRKMIEVAQRGGAHGGPRAYGVDTVDRAKLNGHEVEVIREVADAIIGGESVRSQCLKLNARGDLTPRGNQWAVTTLRRLLLSPRIIGKREHIHTGLHDAVAPAIIDELTQTRLRAAMARPARRGAPARHLLSGILHCGTCGMRMVHHPGHILSRNRDAYICPPPPRGSQCVSIVAALSERWVTDAIIAHEDEFVEFGASEDDDGDALAESIAADYQKLREYGEALAGDMPLTVVQSATSVIQARIRENERALAARTKAPIRRDSQLEAMAMAVATFANYFASFDVDDQRDIIASIVDHIDVLPSTKGAAKTFNAERLNIHWR